MTRSHVKDTSIAKQASRYEKINKDICNNVFNDKVQMCHEK